MFTPENEQGVVTLFSIELHKTRWKIVSIGTQFPDALLELDGEQWRAEFEYSSKNFMLHGHDIRKCDIIICWVNDYPDCPIPVLEISNSDWISNIPTKPNFRDMELDHWRTRALKAEKENQLLKRKLGGVLNRSALNALTDTEELHCKTIVDVVSSNTIAKWEDLVPVTKWSQKTCERYGKLAKLRGLVKKVDGVYKPAMQM